MGVLLVEDERLLDRVVADALRTIGLACETAHSIETALQRLQERHYGLMILDLRLQHGSGVTVLRRARELYPALPVILVTAYTLTDDIPEALALGVDALLYKPFEIDTLLATVRTLLRRGGGQPLSTHALVQLPAGLGAASVRRIEGLEVGTLATLRSAAFSLVGRVRAMDELCVSVETERVEPPGATRWQLEWTGSDALYQIQTRLLEYVPQETVACWLLRQPTTIRRLQRRRHPRLCLSGRAIVSIAGRLQRAVEAELVDLSEEGVGIVLSEPLHRGATLYLAVEASAETGYLAFQREGIVRAVVAFTDQGQPRYRVGVQLQRLPREVIQQLRTLRRQRLIAL